MYRVAIKIDGVEQPTQRDIVRIEVSDSDSFIAMWTLTDALTTESEEWPEPHIELSTAGATEIVLCVTPDLEAFAS